MDDFVANVREEPLSPSSSLSSESSLETPPPKGKWRGFKPECGRCHAKDAGYWRRTQLREIRCLTCPSSQEKEDADDEESDCEKGAVRKQPEGGPSTSKDDDGESDWEMSAVRILAELYSQSRRGKGGGHVIGGGRKQPEEGGPSTSKASSDGARGREESRRGKGGGHVRGGGRKQPEEGGPSTSKTSSDGARGREESRRGKGGGRVRGGGRKATGREESRKGRGGGRVRGGGRKATGREESRKGRGGGCVRGGGRKATGIGRRTLLKNKAPAKFPPANATEVTSDYMFHWGTCYHTGDIVSLIDVEGGIYYAQLRGFLQDRYGEKSAVFSWLLPTQNSPTDRRFFDPSTYVLGPEEDMPHDMEYFELVLHASPDYFKDRNTPYPVASISKDRRFMRQTIGPVEATSTEDMDEDCLVV